jgi:integrase
MRPGEAFGLKWSDLEGNRIRVQRAVVESQEKGGYTIGEPKTKKSKRTVTLLERTTENHPLWLPTHTCDNASHDWG